MAWDNHYVPVQHGQVGAGLGYSVMVYNTIASVAPREAFVSCPGEDAVHAAGVQWDNPPGNMQRATLGRSRCLTWDIA